MNREREILALFYRLVSPYSILYELIESPRRYCDLPLDAYIGRVGILENKTIGYVGSVTSGVGFTKEEALSALFGEAIERYAWSIPPEDEVVLASEVDLSSEYVTVNNAGIIFKKNLESKNFFRKLKTIKIPWMPAKNLIDSSKILIPAIDLFPEMLPPEIIENIFSTTNGVAAGATYDEACLYAIYEVIERDATMQFWYKKSQANEVSWDITSHKIIELFEKAKSLDLEIGILDITTDVGVPSALAYVYYDKSCSEFLTCGSASRLSYQDAHIKALIEAASMWNSLQDFKKYRKHLSPNEISLGFPNINNFEDHVFLYAHSWAKKGYSFLFDSDSPKKKVSKNDFSDSSTEEQLNILLQILKTKGYEVYIMDLTTQDIKDLGLFVVKALIPGFVPLFVGKYKPFYCEHLPENEIINQWPHPFP